MISVFAWVFVFILGTYLFKISAGSLNPLKINILSLSYYFIMTTSVFGACLTSLGYTEHYTYNMMRSPDFYSDISAFFVAVAFMIMPLVSIVFFKAIRFQSKSEYNNYLKKEVTIQHSDIYLVVTIIFAMVTFIPFCAMLKQIGYVPLIKIITNTSFDFAKARHHNVSLEIWGIAMIKSIVVQQIIPILSYIAFAFFLSSKNKFWGILFIFLVLECIVIKTYDFSKLPVIMYFSVIILILIIYYGGIKLKTAAAFSSSSLLLMVLLYRAVGYRHSFLDIYNGILGRTLFTNFGNTAMHFEGFSLFFKPLYGRSMYPTILRLLGVDTDLHLRSGQIIMELYNQSAIYDGVAGVMNCFYIGEAYANWGIPGVILGIIWVSILLSSVFVIFTRIKKTPITIVFFALFTQQMVSTMNGGFIDYIYNATYIIYVFILVFYLNLPKLLYKFGNLKVKRGRI